jgi:ABC-type polar amino acid transport system ATPase subunit
VETLARLVVTGLEVRRGSRDVVRGVSLHAASGEIVVVMGASGSGKTTVLRAVAGLDPIAGGSVVIGSLRLEAGRPLRGETRRELHRQVGMVFQFHHLFEHLTAMQNVSLALVHVLGQSHHTAEQKARGLLEGLGVGSRADALPRELSGGEAQRVAIARALAVGPPVLLMDEPTASLDPARRDDLATTLRALAGEGRTLVVASHDQDFARACAGRVLTMEEGRLARVS